MVSQVSIGARSPGLGYKVVTFRMMFCIQNLTIQEV